jgi:hypothetical protein
LEARKNIGRMHLNANRLQQALEVFADILKENPGDVETHLLLGDWYLASGDAGTAIQLYQRAEQLDPRQTEVASRLRLAQAELAHSPSGQSESVPTDPEALARLLQRLTGRPVVTEAEILNAARVLEEIVSSASPAQAVLERLSEIDALLPALLELNIRQALADGRPDLAEALTLLLDNIHLQMKASPAQTSARRQAKAAVTFRTAEMPRIPAKSAVPEAAQTAAPGRPSVLFVGSPSSDAPLRQVLPAEALRALGCETAVSAEFASEPERRFDVVVVRHPQADPDRVDGLVAGAAFGTRVILDVDMDYAHLPAHHPDKARLGLGTPKQARAYSTALRLAQLVCVPSQPLAQALRGAGHQVMVMPPGWTRSNRLWSKAAPRRDTINVGWIGSPGQMEDVAEIRRPVMRVLREFPQTRLIVGGDSQVYDLFKALPRERRQYLPPVSFDDYAYQLSQVDVLLVPLRATRFNQGASDLRLMEAGIRGIPWVASPLPAYEAWGEGGLLAHTPEEWYAGLQQLVAEADLRATLGHAGRQQAEEREMSRLGPAWLEMIERVQRGPRGQSKA